MVSFSCEACNETMVKKKVQQHLGRCGAAVTCIDCSKTFPGVQFKDHNQCITENEKYQGKLFKPKAKPSAPKPAALPEEKPAGSGKSKKDSTMKDSTMKDSTMKDSVKKSAKVSKATPLRKYLRALRKKKNVSKKQLLKDLVVDADGRLVLA